MRVSQCVECTAFSCQDMKHDCYFVPNLNLKPESISLIMISDDALEEPTDFDTTIQAFNDAGIPASSAKDLLKRGVYLTSAVKCGKTGRAISTETIRACSHHLEKELALFPNAKVLMLMGDVAIKAVNHIAQRAGEKRVIPAGPTYKLRGQPYYFRGMRVFPSYLQAGPSFFIEKSKRRMIAEDIATAMPLAS